MRSAGVAASLNSTSGFIFVEDFSKLLLDNMMQLFCLGKKSPLKVEKKRSKISLRIYTL